MMVLYQQQIELENQEFMDLQALDSKELFPNVLLLMIND